MKKILVLSLLLASSSAFAQNSNGQYISQLPSATALTGAEIIPLVQSGTTKNVTINNLDSFLGSLPTAGLFTSVGIGTTSAGTYALNVQQAGYMQVFFGSTGANNVSLNLNSSAGQYDYIQLQHAGTTAYQVGMDSSNDFFIYSSVGTATLANFSPNNVVTLGQAQTFDILANGNVGIGTTGPNSKLTVTGLGTTSPGTGGGYVCADSAGDFYVKSTCP